MPALETHYVEGCRNARKATADWSQVTCKKCLARRKTHLIERQEIWCHACEGHICFDIDLALDGNHVLKCPKCGHEHCRVVRNGRVTRDRWDRRNGIPTHQVSMTTAVYSASTTSTTTTLMNLSSSGDRAAFMAESWLATTSTS